MMVRSLLLATLLIATMLFATARAGSWGTGSFDNDDAADFVVDVVAQGSTQPLRAALLQAASGKGYLEAPDAAAALAAAEMVAAARGKPTSAAKGNSDVTGWVGRTHPTVDPALVADALRAVDRILGEDSELRELWSESEQYDAWRAGVAELRAHLE
jgi:hypothetical protein